MTLPILDSIILVAVGMSPAVIMSIICAVATADRESK